MDRLAGSFLSNGDVANASSLYNSLEKLNPTRYSRMARICRVLLNPQGVPLPHRHRDICEALLDPLVPPEVLLRDSAENVQKSFQRLAVCAHPDKNPNPSANEAFLRLTMMKDKALELLRDGVERKCDGATEAPPGKAAASNGRKGKPKMQNSGPAVPTVAHRRRPLRPGVPLPEAAAAVTSDTTAAAVSSKISQLRRTKITLNALKRKDIADDFEIFSATQRTTAVQSEVSHSDVEEDNLATTVPVMSTKERARRANRGRSQSSAPQERTKTLPRASSPNTNPLLSSSLYDAMPVPSHKPLSPSPQTLEDPTGSVKSSGAGDRDASALYSPSIPTAAISADSDAIRRQIDEACLRLREMRLQHTTVHLDLDLSFEAYERSKQPQ
ncbi:hypothetical protein, conserved [Leishmania donovani]|uniref:DnaJ domain containing protein, putative n=1 Tax=Leishmania donovani TaxID=5661 RepID=A0A3S7WSS6_LEIDO|nr:hypothetical protein, conserved [Leishmania donovani]AYU77250.1 DnaJ domain containing protein, putative [Leishmania donovani]TPP46191.1 DnaJ domain family protein [Leishmania donovani]CBZ32669.1 hypothetical protein, conserved [Leishmania donovani]